MRSYLKTLTTRTAGRQMIRLGVIGVLNTINFLILFNILRNVAVPRDLAVTIAFAAATFVSYVLNRRWTFGLPDNAGGAIETAQFYIVNVVSWAVTVGVINLADLWFGPLSRLGENVASLAAGVIVLIPKLASYRDIVFRKALGRSTESTSPGTHSTETNV